VTEPSIRKQVSMSSIRFAVVGILVLFMMMMMMMMMILIMMQIVKVMFSLRQMVGIQSLKLNKEVLLLLDLIDSQDIFVSTFCLP
jgi:hypothetical protein